MKRKFEYMTDYTADPHIVKLLMEHLIAAYEQFIAQYPGTVDYMDGLMAAHNFHKAIVADLVERTGEALWWNICLATFEEAIKREEKPGRSNAGRTP